MSLKSVLEFIENKSDMMQKHSSELGTLRAAFYSGSLAIAFGLVAGFPVFVAGGAAAVAIPVWTCGLAHIANRSAHFFRQKGSPGVS